MSGPLRSVHVMAGSRGDVFLLCFWALCARAVFCACTTGLYTCLKTDLATAFDKISRADSYHLMPGLSFDRNSPEQAPGEPNIALDQPGTPTVDNHELSFAELYSRVESIFRSHSLYWNLLPGIDLAVYSSRNGNFHLGVTRCDHEDGKCQYMSYPFLTLPGKGLMPRIQGSNKTQSKPHDLNGL